MRIGTDIAYDGSIAGGVAAPVAMTVPDTVSEEQAAGIMRLERAAGTKGSCEPRRLAAVPARDRRANVNRK